MQYVCFMKNLQYSNIFLFVGRGINVILKGCMNIKYVLSCTCERDGYISSSLGLYTVLLLYVYHDTPTVYPVKWQKSFYLMTRSMIVSKCHVSLKLDESLMKLSDCALNVYTSTDTSFWAIVCLSCG